MNPVENRGTRRLPSAVQDRIKVWVELGYPTKATELKIVRSRCSEYALGGSELELVLELVDQTRHDPAVERPASIRSSIGIARLAGERAKRLGKPVDAAVLADSAQLVLGQALQMKPSRNKDKYLESLLVRVLGTRGS